MNFSSIYFIFSYGAGKEKVAQVLLSHGANVNSQDFAGETPLHRSVSNGELDEIFQITIKDTQKYFFIVAVGHSNIVNLLIDNNANVNTASNDGSTALHLAYNSDKMKIAQKLIQHGADLTSENKNGESVVGLALNHVVKGLSTIFYGVKEIVHKGMKILKNPTEAIKQSNLHTIQLNIQHLPTVEMQFGKKTNNDPSDRSDQSDQSDDRIRSKSNGDFSPQPTLRFNFLH